MWRRSLPGPIRSDARTAVQAFREPVGTAISGYSTAPDKKRPANVDTIGVKVNFGTADPVQINAFLKMCGVSTSIRGVSRIKARRSAMPVVARFARSASRPAADQA